MPHHLGGALDPDALAAKFVLEPRIAALCDSALVVPDGLGWSEFDLLAPARVVIHQRHVPQAAAVFAQLGAALGGIHEIVAVGHPFGAHQRQRNGGTAVVHRRGGDQRADGHATVGGVQMQFEAVPTDLVALGIALGATITRRGNFPAHLRQCLLALAMDGRLLGRRANFAASRATPFALRCRSALFCRTLCGGRRRGRLRFGMPRPLTRRNGRTVSTDVPDQFFSPMLLDERLMHALGQARLGEFLEGAREGRL